MFNHYPEKTYSRTEVMSKPTPVPAVNGVYFWWFKEIPPSVPTENCITCDGYTLLYVGISPDRRGKPNSRSNLRKRIKTHYSGNAAGSTLRRTLGVLLSNVSSFPLRRVGSGSRMTFTHPGEQWLDAWMEKNANAWWQGHTQTSTVRLLCHAPTHKMIHLGREVDAYQVSEKGHELCELYFLHQSLLSFSPMLSFSNCLKNGTICAQHFKR
jgi:hypothetical protein